MSRYLYKHIQIVEISGCYHADYVRPNGTRFVLHRASCDTRAKSIDRVTRQIKVSGTRKEMEDYFREHAEEV